MANRLMILILSCSQFTDTLGLLPIIVEMGRRLLEAVARESEG
jgi:hypothetical protein